MFWSKNKEKINVSSSGIGINITLDKSVTPKDYIDFISKLIEPDTLAQACFVMEDNGHVNTKEKITELLNKKYNNYAEKVMDTILSSIPLQQDNKENNEKKEISPASKWL